MKKRVEVQDGSAKVLGGIRKRAAHAVLEFVSEAPMLAVDLFAADENLAKPIQDRPRSLSGCDAIHPCSFAILRSHRELLHTDTVLIGKYHDRRDMGCRRMQKLAVNYYL